MKYANLINQPVPQSEALDDRQVQNNAGGFVFQLDIWKRLDRFLVLGSDSNTYYQKAQDLTRENAKCVTACFDNNAVKTIDRIVSISVEGRAPKNDAAIFALAIGAAHSDVKVRQLALAAMPSVCRTSTHLFQFVKAARALGRGWGRSMKRAVAKWYNDKDVNALAYQVIKYREREGYTHKRLMQTAHPDPGKDASRVALYKWLWGKDEAYTKLPLLVQSHLVAMDANLNKKDRMHLIAEHNLPWEALPTECNADADYWAAMLPKMGLTALIRNLGNMSRIGLIKPLSAAEKLIAERLSNKVDLRKSRIHPFNVLQALSVYSSGKGFKGKGQWDVSRPVVDALDSAFYKSFKNVVPTNKRHLIALDVSGSMSSPMMGSSLSWCQATAALAMIAVATEPQSHVVGFFGGGKSYGYRTRSNINVLDGIHPLNISAKMSLNAAMNEAQKNNFGSTDCALPMIYALEKKLEVDCFTVMTDNETWAGSIHPVQALKDYRKKTGINAKLIVVGMTATNFSIADPNDAGMLDVVGFASDAPAVMADFARN
jgi:60 kDa SS-A/Ro ribonucleoprotein